MSSGKQPREKVFLELIREKSTKASYSYTGNKSLASSTQRPAAARDWFAVSPVLSPPAQGDRSLRVTGERGCGPGFIGAHRAAGDQRDQGVLVKPSLRAQPGARAAELSRDTSKVMATSVPSFPPCRTVSLLDPPHSRGEPATPRSLVLLRRPVRCEELQMNLVPAKTWASSEAFTAKVWCAQGLSAHDTSGFEALGTGGCGALQVVCHHSSVHGACAMGGPAT